MHSVVLPEDATVLFQVGRHIFSFQSAIVLKIQDCEITSVHSVHELYAYVFCHIMPFVSCNVDPYNTEHSSYHFLCIFTRANSDQSAMPETFITTSTALYATYHFWIICTIFFFSCYEDHIIIAHLRLLKAGSTRAGCSDYQDVINM